MRRHPTAALSVVLLALSGAGPAATPAAGQAGTAVAVTPSGEALVLRPTSGRGRASVMVFERAASGEWTRAASLEPGADAEPYEGFGASLAAARDVIAAAGADDDVVWGARVFRRSGAGWSAAEPVPVASRRPAHAATRPAAMDMTGLMRIMSPPPRVVGLDPDARTLAVWAAGPGAGTVHVLRRSAPGGWEHAARLPVRDSTLPQLVRIAAGVDRIAVGDPTRPGGGAVRVFVRRGTGEWVPDADVTLEGEGDGRLGAALDLAGDRLAVGAPARGVVAVYARRGGQWTLEALIPAGGAEEAGGAGGAFGTAVAWSGGDLWIGAPAEDGVRGAVYRYVEDAGTGTWRQAERFVPGDDHPAGSRLGLGYALAAAGDLVVAGAPAAHGGAGGAAVIERRDGAWRGPVWLKTGVDVRTVTGREVRCEDGTAAGFDCGNVDLLSFLDLRSLGAAPGERVSDIWGWADPETGREYALVGRTAGMAIVDVTHPSAPEHVALVPGNPAGLRDIKVYDDHAFFVGDGAGAHGLLVFDLRRLRSLDPGGAPVVLEPDARYDGIGSAHNLVMDPETGLAVPVGASGTGETCGGGLHMVDVTTPTAPTFAGCYTDDVGLIAPGRTHDAQCLIYRGPDDRYHGRRICLASNETALRIVDVTDPAAPIEVAHASYPGVSYTHQGWLTEDQRYFFMNDELDELVGVTDRTRTLIWDVAELDDPVMVGEHYGPDIATDHNLFIRGDRMYQANYQAGLRVVDISDPENPRDIGFFDTTPYGPNHAGFGGGAWTAYPFLPSGTVLVSSINEGLFLLRPRPRLVP